MPKASKINLKIPKEDVVIDVFYQAKLPAILLIYDTSDKDNIKLVKATPMEGRLDVGRTKKKTVPTTMPGDSKKKITSIAVSSGDIKGAFGATSNGYKENKLPTGLKVIEEDCSKLTGDSYQTSFEMQNKPTYLIATYGGNPLEPDPEKDNPNKPKTIDLNGIEITTVGTPSDVVTPFEVTLPPTPTNASNSQDAMDGVRNIDAIGKIEADKTKNPQLSLLTFISSEFLVAYFVE